MITQLLPAFEKHCHVDAADIPDLVPILAVMAAAREGAVFTNIRRLRLKESDRVMAVENLIQSLGGKTESTENELTVYGTGLTGGTVNSYNDHRIAMAAAIAATVCSNPVTISGAEAVNKSYPSFWNEYRKLGGHYEQYLR
jgi:3-phosphoshikimate 1-carboxyvinyltransferase